MSMISRRMLLAGPAALVPTAQKKTKRRRGPVGWSSQAQIAQLVIIEGAGDALYVYDGTPAPGNLIASITSITSAAGSDGQGNATLPGISAYGSTGGVGHAASIQGGRLALFDNVAFPSGAWPATPVATLDFNANLDTLISTAGQLAMKDGAGLQQQVSGSKLANPASAGPYPIQDTGTTLTSLGFMTVPANDVETGASYQVHASGSFSTGTSVPSSATFTLFWGGIGAVTIATLAIPGTLASGLSGAGWWADAEVNFIGAAACKVTLKVGWHSGSGVSGSETLFVIGSASGLTVTSDENLSLGFQWGSAPSGTSLSCEVFRAGRVA